MTNVTVASAVSEKSGRLSAAIAKVIDYIPTAITVALIALYYWSLCNSAM